VLGIHEYLYDSSPVKLNLALMYMVGNLSLGLVRRMAIRLIRKKKVLLKMKEYEMKLIALRGIYSSFFFLGIFLNLIYSYHILGFSYYYISPSSLPNKSYLFFFSLFFFFFFNEIVISCTKCNSSLQ
jgi:hypothetical protein